jgi:hypothetical protein
MHKLDPAALTTEQAARFYREMVAADGRAAASSQVQARNARLCLRIPGWIATSSQKPGALCG